MPRTLKFDADQEFFERGLNGVDVVVHGRHSRERHRRSDMRRRLILTRSIPSIASDANNRNALFWNPAGATLEQALAVLGAPNGSLGVIGGTDVFGFFLDRYDIDTRARGPDTRRTRRFSRGCAEFLADLHRRAISWFWCESSFCPFARLDRFSGKSSDSRHGSPCCWSRCTIIGDANLFAQAVPQFDAFLMALHPR
jgi:hypothetical protein